MFLVSGGGLDRFAVERAQARTHARLRVGYVAGARAHMLTIAAYSCEQPRKRVRVPTAGRCGQVGTHTYLQLQPRPAPTQHYAGPMATFHKAQWRARMRAMRSLPLHAWRTYVCTQRAQLSACVRYRRHTIH